MATASTLLSRLKLTDPDLALLCVPSEYVDCGRSITRLRDADTSGKVSQLLSLAVTGEVKAVRRDKRTVMSHGKIVQSLEELQDEPFAVWKNIGRLQLELVDQAGQTAKLSSFQPLGWRSIRVGQTLHFIGTTKWFGDELCISSELEPPSEAIGGIWTRYAGIPGQISAESIAEMVHAVRYKDAAYLKAAREIVSAMQLDEVAVLELVQYDQTEQPASVPKFERLGDLLGALHLPRTVQGGARALQLAQRISAASIRTAARSQSIRHAHRDAPLIVPDQQVLDLAATQPETLSQDQKVAILGIANGLRSPVPMNALLSGDVGTGKTLAFLLPAVVAHQNGALVAIVAPTIILANQIAKQIARRFGAVIRGVERVEAGKKIQNPGHILIGTSGLTGACAKANLVPNLVILDEQHKLSVQTRSALVGPATHVLEATATPIPRSLATVFFDGLDVFSLRQAPVERQITSHVIDVANRGQVSRAIRDTIAGGRRVLVVYPRLDTVEITKKSKTKKGEQLDLNSAPAPALTRAAQGVLEAAATFEQAFPGKVAVLHGELSDEDKEREIEQVRRLEKPLAVASVVVETGIDIPDIGLVVVRDADQLGLSQLHQLRGRLVRNGGAADFFMMVESIDNLEDAALERLVACRLTTDGYRLAEIDMRQRGFGSYVDDSQTGNTQGVFRLTKIAPADFLGMANETATGSSVDAEELRDIKEAEALMKRVVREAQELRQRLAAPGGFGETSAAAVVPAVRCAPHGSVLTRPPARPAPRPLVPAPVPVPGQPLGFRALPSTPKPPVAPPRALPAGALERMQAGFNFEAAEPRPEAAPPANPSVIPGFPPRRTAPTRS
ncbi:MAG: DEAD/DEAH box helicase [Proteobacteria bacterium]|nr:DEAD/DEAH box helicase [Pseudomonadota bacterium]